MNAINVGSSQRLSRRDFLKHSTTAAVSATVLSSGLPHVFAAGSEEIKVGLIGCGGRGTGAATQVLMATDTPVRLWAMADLFPDKIEATSQLLTKGGKGRYDREDITSLAAKMTVPEERKFVGFEAYKKLLASDVDLVILATPPGFRPDHFKAAVEAGKHVFMEKPVAVDPVGIRTVIEAAALAKQKKLSVVAGTQRRHQNHYLEIMKRIHDGAIGEIIGGQFYWNSGGSTAMMEQPAGVSDMEWQCRRWYPFCWLSGDHIVEQHVHNIDVMNWALGSHPVSAMGMGGRQVRRSGNIWDNFAIEFEFPGGVRTLSMCRQIPGCSDRVAERIVGTKGVVHLNEGAGRIEGPNTFQSRRSHNPYVQEHADLIRSIREGTALNEGLQVAESSLTAIIGRMSAYTGKVVDWDWAIKESKLDMRPTKLEFGPLPVSPIPVQGQTPLI
jgi:myo-inositol 2-dehydrogenase / D-chiro-inositol 1-dehydrogenase